MAATKQQTRKVYTNYLYGCLRWSVLDDIVDYLFGATEEALLKVIQKHNNYYYRYTEPKTIATYRNSAKGVVELIDWMDCSDKFADSSINDYNFLDFRLEQFSRNSDDELYAAGKEKWIAMMKKVHGVE